MTYAIAMRATSRATWWMKEMLRASRWRAARRAGEYGVRRGCRARGRCPWPLPPASSVSGSPESCASGFASGSLKSAVCVSEEVTGVYHLVGKRLGLGVELAPHMMKRDLAALRLQPCDQRVSLPSVRSFTRSMTSLERTVTKKPGARSALCVRRSRSSSRPPSSPLKCVFMWV